MPTVPATGAQGPSAAGEMLLAGSLATGVSGGVAAATDHDRGADGFLTTSVERVSTPVYALEPFSPSSATNEMRSLTSE